MIVQSYPFLTTPAYPAGPFCIKNLINCHTVDLSPVLIMVIIENLQKVTQIDLMPIVECLQHELARYIQYPFFKGAEFVFAELKS